MEATQRLNPTTMTMTTNKKKKPNQTLENKFQFELNSCSKSKDFRGAISLYDDAVSNKTRLNQHHLNALLYLCSNAVTNPSLKHLALDYGFRIFNHMSSLNITPNEATVATVARLAAANGDGDRAFELVKDIGKYNVAPRLRTYDPALFCFCEFLDADKAYEVEKHMNSVGVSLEEAEIAALLKVSAKKGRVDRVYRYLHKLRSGVRCVAESTAAIIEEWFQSSEAREVGDEDLDARRIREGVLRNGGGWHGLGWVGKGDWVVSRTRVDNDGICCGCALAVCTNKFITGASSIGLWCGQLRWKAKRQSYKFNVEWRSCFRLQKSLIIRGKWQTYWPKWKFNFGLL